MEKSVPCTTLLKYFQSHPDGIAHNDNSRIPGTIEAPVWWSKPANPWWLLLCDSPSGPRYSTCSWNKTFCWVTESFFHKWPLKTYCIARWNVAGTLEPGAHRYTENPKRDPKQDMDLNGLSPSMESSSSDPNPQTKQGPHWPPQL